MNIVHKLALDLQMPVGGKIYVKQGDKMTRSIVLSLYDGGAPFNPPNVGILQLVFLKPDRTGGVYDTMPDGTKACVLSGNTVTASLHPQMFTASGTVVCELRMLNADGSSILSTFGWSIFVEASAEAGIKSESYYHFASISSLTAAIGNLNDLVTNDKESIVGAINELHSVTVSITKTEVVARSEDGCNYSADVEGLEISVGTEIILIPQSTNLDAPTLSINGGEAYPLCLRPGWNVTGDDRNPQLTLPIPSGMLLRGAEYVFRFDGYSWILQSYVEAAPEYVDMTDAYRADDDYRGQPQEYLRSLGVGKWTLDDGWAIYSTHCWEVSGTVWVDEAYSTDDGFYRRTLTANGQEVVYLDSGDGVLRINGQPLSGGAELDWAEMDAVIGEAMSEDNGGTGCVTEARMQAYVTERLQGAVTEEAMKAYVKEYVDSTLAAIPIAEEGAY